MVSLTNIDVPVPFGSREQFATINNAGTVVGTYESMRRTFLYRVTDGTPSLTVLDGTPLALNDRDDLLIARGNDGVEPFVMRDQQIELVDRSGKVLRLGTLPKLGLADLRRAYSSAVELEPQIHLNSRRQLVWTIYDWPQAPPVVPWSDSLKVPRGGLSAPQWNAFFCQLPSASSRP